MGPVHIYGPDLLLIRVAALAARRAARVTKLSTKYRKVMPPPSNLGC
jgi:hypothetical protein